MLERYNLLILDVQPYAEVDNLGTECEKLRIAILDVVSEAHDFALQRGEALSFARYGGNVLLKKGYHLPAISFLSACTSDARRMIH